MSWRSYNSTVTFHVPLKSATLKVGTVPETSTVPYSFMAELVVSSAVTLYLSAVMSLGMVGNAVRVLAPCESPSFTIPETRTVPEPEFAVSAEVCFALSPPPELMSVQPKMSSAAKTKKLIAEKKVVLFLIVNPS